MINLSYKDDLNSFYLEEGLADFLIENIKKNDFSIELLNKKEDKCVFLTRILMMISKLTKNELFLFLKDKNFLEKLILLSESFYFEKNSIIHDNVIR